jgi:hypothetical protein
MPDHVENLSINDTYLFMAMYSDGFVKTLEKNETFINDGLPAFAIIANMLMQKIKSEPSLNSAAQSVLDEVKRTHDDKFHSKDFEREDFTLAVRVFDSDIKTKLKEIDNMTNTKRGQSKNYDTVKNGAPKRSQSSSSNQFQFVETLELNPGDDDEQEEDDEESNDSIRTTTATSVLDQGVTLSRTRNSVKRSDCPVNDLIDENGLVKPYVNLKELNNILESEENKDLINEFIEKLENCNYD